MNNCAQRAPKGRNMNNPVQGEHSDPQPGGLHGAVLTPQPPLPPGEGERVKVPLSFRRGAGGEDNRAEDEKRRRFDEKVRTFGEKVRTFCEKVRTFGEKVRTFCEKVRTSGEKVRTFCEKVCTFGEKVRTFCEKVCTFGEKVRTPAGTIRLFSCSFLTN